MTEASSADLPEIRPRRSREKLAILVYLRDLLYHYEPVMQHFGPEELDLIVYAEGRERAAIEARLREMPFVWYQGRDLIAAGSGYRWLISNHVAGHESLNLTLRDGRQIAYRGYPLRLLGWNNLRFMYALGADYWNLSDWNALYDGFLCYGPHQAAQLARFAGAKMLMGYPRYDAFFNQPLTAAAKNRLLTELGGSPGKPTLVWFTPLMAWHAGLETFAAAIGALSASYNLFVKPHPASWNREPDYIAALERHVSAFLLREPIDNLLLYQVADYVIAEYCGPAYGALYTDKNLLLLDHPDYPGRAGEDLRQSDTDAWLRRKIVHLLPGQAQALPGLLADTGLWREQANIRAELRKIFFAPNYGQSAATAARLIRQWMENPQSLSIGSS